MTSKWRTPVTVAAALTLAALILAALVTGYAGPGRLSGLRGADRVAVIEDGAVALYQGDDAQAMLTVLRGARATSAQDAASGAAVNVVVFTKGRLEARRTLVYVPGARTIVAGREVYRLSKPLPILSMPGGRSTLAIGYDSVPTIARPWVDGVMKKDTAVVGHLMRSEVLVVSMGPKPTSGYEVRLVGLDRTDTAWKLLFEFSEPGRGQGVNDVLTTPTFIAAFSLPEVQVFEKTKLGQKKLALGDEQIPVPQPEPPGPVTLDDERQVEELIRTYFDAMERGDWGAAWDLETSSQQAWSTRADYVATQGGLESVKLLSVKAYLPPPAPTWDVPPDTPTVNFMVTLEVKPKPNTAWGPGGVVERFVGVQKENGKWYISGLATSP